MYVVGARGGRGLGVREGYPADNNGHCLVKCMHLNRWRFGSRGE